MSPSPRVGCYRGMRQPGSKAGDDIAGFSVGRWVFKRRWLQLFDVPLILAPYLPCMNAPNYWRKLSTADRLRLVAFEAILQGLPIWMVVEIWKVTGKGRRRPRLSAGGRKQKSSNPKAELFYPNHPARRLPVS